MKHITVFIIFALLTSMLVSCAPYAVVVDGTPTQPDPTQTSIPPIATLTFTALPTETPPPSETPSPTPPSCAVPLNPTENAKVPARGPFDFTWTAFEGAASYVISIGPTNWYPTYFPVSGTTLTRYMENFPSSPSYEWSISAVNATGQEICKSGPYKFVTSQDLFATPSFATNSSSVSPTVGNAANNSSPSEQNGSNDSSSSNSFSDTSLIIVSDGDSQDCQLAVGYNVKSNHVFTFFRLRYGVSPDAMDNFVDFTTISQEPYPAYNYYTAVTPVLPVKNGDTVYFAT